MQPVETSRGEVWAPVWNRPCTIMEIRQLFGEARASWQGKPAQHAVDFYAATRTLGVARGLSGFVRYGLQQRNGLAFVAVPVATVEVRSKPEVRLAARVEDWVSWLRRPDTSSAVGAAARRFDAAHLAYARDGGPRALADLLAALTGLEQAVGRSGRARQEVPVRRPPPAGAFLAEFARVECAELRVAVGIASCTTRPGAGTPARSMRQILLPVDPGDSVQQAGQWRGTPMVPGFGPRPLREVLSDVLVWRSRTAADEKDGPRPRLPSAAGQTTAEGSDNRRFRGVPTFRWGVPVPTADLHAFALGLLDEGELDLWLRASLALDWSGTRGPWTEQPDQVIPVPTLGLLQPLARGMPTAGDSADSTALALGPGWASRLAAGQIRPVHEAAVARLRQAGWQAVPYQPVLPTEPQVTGPDIAAALVPRCREPQQILRRCLAVRIRDEATAEVGPEVGEETRSPRTANPELTEELL